VENPSAK